jgi:2-polyprenyl-3-methyl-5-hydroxy-6-metoxy-1,4-benzoquinol methylase
MKNEDVAALEELEDGHWWGEERKYRLIRLVERYIPRNSKVLEVGCGNGKILSRLTELDFDCFGVEPSKTGFLNANKLLPGRIFHGTLDDYTNSKTEKEFFDCILLFDVLEHLLNDEEQLISIAKMLKKNGFVIFSVPADPKLWSNLDEEVYHFRRYTKKSLLTLMSSVELQIHQLDYWCSILKVPIKVYRKVLNPSFISNIKKPVPIVNWFLCALIRVERISLFTKIPGVSIFGVVQKSN